MAERHGRSKLGFRATLSIVVAGLAVIMAASPTLADTAGLSTLTNWVIDEVYLANTNGLPVDHEFAAPIAAHYNWAYGATVVGLNVKSVGAEEYYAVCSLYDNGQLDPLAVIGPMASPAQFVAGKYFLAAGLADGRLIVWLTAPGQYPREMVYTSSYTPGSAFDFTVYTTDPPTAEYEKWEVIGAYQYYSGGINLAVENLDGLGNLIKGYGSISLRGDLASVSYLDFPTAGGWIPYLLYTVIRDDRIEAGNNQHLVTYAAWQSKQGGWVPEILREGGLYNGTVYTGFGSRGSYGLVAYDESSSVSNASWLTLVVCSDAANSSIASQESNRDALPNFTSLETFQIFEAAGHQFPLYVGVDSVKVQLGYYAPSVNRPSNSIGYQVIDLHIGEEVQSGNGYEPVYPITSIAGAAHWSTGDPEIFWVQQGNVNHLGGQVYRLGYEPRYR